MRQFLVAVGIMALAGTAGADYGECWHAYRDKLWHQAFEACHAEAVKADKGEGDRRALGLVGALYMNGQGTDRDYGEAMRWFRKAADRGSVRAMATIGSLYQHGLGTDRDDSEAMRWFRKAADRGSDIAMSAIGYLYMAGRGADRDASEAMRWFRKAADRGNGIAMSAIGDLYGEGSGVAQDDEAARRWYKKSAETGYYVGQYNYGITLVGRAVRGPGTEDDLVTGYMYLILSAEQGKGDARFREERIGYWKGLAENELTYSQIDEAKRRAQNWRKVSR